LFTLTAGSVKRTSKNYPSKTHLKDRAIRAVYIHVEKQRLMTFTIDSASALKGTVKGKGKGSLMPSALLSAAITDSRHSGMARVNEGTHRFACYPHVYLQVE